MSLLARSAASITVLLASIAALALACGSSDDSTFDENDGRTELGDGGGGTFGTGGEGDEQPDADLYANDPPPKWCGPDAGAAPPQPGGTEACPDDKNKPGCGCSNAGEKAKCWTGLRKHRGLGICKDGETTCVATNETALEWGACEGEVLPASGATKGPEACACFSAGQWKIANLSPCAMKFCNGATCVVNAVSTVVDGSGVARCPAQNPPSGPPSQDWSTDTLKVDCAGHFKLCLRVRGGDFDNPSPSDCILGESCTESEYVEVNEEQPWPNLPAWLGADTACAQKWYDTPENTSAGYAEMIVKGQSVRCDAIDDGSGGDLVFNRVKYCPMMCNKAENATQPECVSCQQSGQGQF